MISKPTVIELFAGAGLFSYAFKSAGFKIKLAIEKDQTAAETYAINVGSHVVCSDIRKVKPKGECDVLIAGPPCQGFSTLGKRQENDPRNSLAKQVVKWVRVAKPSIVVIENVPAFLKSKNYTSVSRSLKRMGYQLDVFVLNAYDFGCPQLRVRSFVIANSSGCSIQTPKGRKRCRTVRQAWEGLSARPNGKNQHYSPKPSQLALSRMRVIPIGGNKRDIIEKSPELAPPSWKKLGNAAADVWGRMNWDQPANTLRTCFQNPSKGRYIHPEQHRVISLREAARLHTIPDRWRFAGLPTQITRQIGNSVPPSLGKAVAKAVLSYVA